MNSYIITYICISLQLVLHVEQLTQSLSEDVNIEINQEGTIIVVLLYDAYEGQKSSNKINIILLHLLEQQYGAI